MEARKIMSEEFVKVEITKDGKEQQLQLIYKNGEKKIFRLKDFPHHRGGPVITGQWDIEEIKDEN
jgi:hypothetical protein